MLEYLKQMIRRFRDWPSSFPPFDPPGDPIVGVRHPRWRPDPGGRLASAVEEPDEEPPPAAAIGRIRRAEMPRRKV
jgi:hypothetical protein